MIVVGLGLSVTVAVIGQSHEHGPEGPLGLKVGRRKLTLEAGDVAVVDPGTPHRFWNAGDDEVRFVCEVRPALQFDDEVRFVCEVRPALQFESLVETMFALAADGKTNRKGMPSPLRLAVIALAHFDTVRLPHPPAWLQCAGLALGALLGRGLGYRPTYEPVVDASAIPAV